MTGEKEKGPVGGNAATFPNHTEHEKGERNIFMISHPY